MIPNAKLRHDAVNKIVAHNCPDGIAGALILLHVWPEAEVLFMQYNTSEHIDLEPKGGMCFVDFSPHDRRIGEFAKAGAIVLEHHKTRRDAVGTFGELGVFGDEKKEPGVSGAVLAFRSVFSAAPTTTEMFKAAPRMEELARLVGIRDTWQSKHPDWFEACSLSEALRVYPLDTLRNASDKEWADIREVGRTLYKRKVAFARTSIEKGQRFMVGPHRVIMFNNVVSASDAAEMLDDEVDIVCGYFIHTEHGEPQITFSLRSHTGFDVGELARSYGGGGHSASAGFTVKEKDRHPSVVFIQSLLAWDGE